MTDIRVVEEGKRDNFTIIPNLIDDLGLSPYAVRLYFHLKRVAGEKGECWQSGDTMAKICAMSTGTISKAKKELVKLALIRVEVKSTEKNIYHQITIIDVWERNKVTSISRSEQPSPSEILSSPDEKLPSPSERLSSPDETNKNPLNKNTINKNTINKNTAQRQILNANNEEAIGVFRDVAKYTPAGTDWLRAIELIRDTLKGHEDFGRDEVVEYLKTYAVDWTGRRTKEGKPYSIRNLVWLERAAAGEQLSTPAQVTPGEGAAITPLQGGGQYV